MAKRKKAEAATDAQLQTQVTEAHHAEVAKLEDKTVGHVANPSATPRPHNFAQQVKKLPSKKQVSAGDLIVQMIDAGKNEMGIGIRVVLLEDHKLTDAEKEIIREHMKAPTQHGRPSPFSWDRGSKMWHAEIGENSPGTRNVALRLDAEGRVEKLAEALKAHQADPVGYAEMVKQQREQAAEAGRIPD